jgi:FAD/FMN-containing dehydrogenase
MIIEREDAGWDVARQAWNLAVDQQPAAIAEPSTPAELQAAVRTARREGLRIATQATGHGAEALGPLDDTLLLKTSRLRAIEPRADTVRVEAGVLAAAAADAAGAQGRAPVVGLAATVGVTGLTVGGGIGWLGRCHGLAANNVRAFDVVLADGEQARVDAEHEPDLFWALRGGGGRGAIVSALELHTHALPAVFAGSVAWPAKHAAEVLEQFRRCTHVAPEALSLVFRHIAPAGLVTVMAVFLGTEADAIAALAPLRSGGGAVHDTFGPIGPAALPRVAADPEEPGARGSDSFLLDDLEIDTTERIAELLDGDALAPLAVVELRHLGGALSRVPRDHGALARLEAGYSVFASGQAADVDALTAIDQRCEELRQQLRPWTARQALLNGARGGTDPATGFDAPTWERLERVRDAYDPDRVLVSGHDLYAEKA